ncbi:MAG: hypothetical protein K2X66_10155, partial [Cyanobacteria bacterium]|nr:hypothetical protein [Cyanobacteriota bacterium]
PAPARPGRAGRRAGRAGRRGRDDAGAAGVPPHALRGTAGRARGCNQPSQAVRQSGTNPSFSFNVKSID